MKLSIERMAVFVMFVIIGFSGFVAMPTILVPNQAVAKNFDNDECDIDESLCVLGKADADFTDIQNYHFVHQWGSKGTADGQFTRPLDMDFDKNYKNLYVVDTDGNRIQVFDKNGKFLFKFGQKGQGDGQFLEPSGLDIDAKGNVWVADRGNQRIQEFDTQGNFILKFGNTGGNPSTAPGKFDNPSDVEVDRVLKYVYVADSKNNRIQQFDINGNFVKVIGGLGNMRGVFNLPSTIEVDSKGNFFVNEGGNDRILKFDGNWKPILKWGSKDTSDYQFCHMEHLDLDNHDNVYVTDAQSDSGCSMQPRVLKFDSDGTFITEFGSKGTLPGQFEVPEQMALDDQGNVYVSDIVNNNIQVFKPIKD